MNKRNFTVKVSVFPGFYESDYHNSDTSYWAIREELEYMQEERPELTENDLDFDYDAYCEDVRNNFVDVWENKLINLGIITKAEFDHMWSPKYYNYATDEIYCKVTLVNGWQTKMREFIKENYEWLKNRISEDWTSYDGFMSFMENDVDDWSDNLFKKLDERYIDCMLTYMLLKDAGSVDNLRNDFYEWVMDDIYAGSYVYVIADRKDEEAEAASEA